MELNNFNKNLCAQYTVPVIAIHIVTEVLYKMQLCLRVRHLLSFNCTGVGPSSKWHVAEHWCIKETALLMFVATVAMILFDSSYRATVTVIE